MQKENGLGGRSNLNNAYVYSECTVITYKMESCMQDIKNMVSL